MSFRDEDGPRGVSRWHSGANPWMKEEIFGQCLEGGFSQPESTEDRLIRNSSLELFLKELGPAIREAVKQACKRYLKGEPAVGHIVFSCTRGRHRSYAVAESAVAHIRAEELFECALLVHHCRPIPGFDDRPDCGCAKGECK